MVWTDYKDKKVYLQVKTINGIWGYTGIVTDVLYMGKSIDNVEIYFLEIIDIKGDRVGFSSTQIKFIKEER